MVSKEELMNHSFVWLTLKHTWGKVHKVLETSAEVEVGNTVEMVAFNHMNIIQNELEPGDRVMVADLQKQGVVVTLQTPYFVGGTIAVSLIVDGMSIRRGYSELERILEITEVSQQDRLKNYCDSIYADEKPQEDIIKSPNHYTAGGIEVKTVMKAKLSGEEFKGYCKGNILKYLMRAPHKGAEKQDYQKAAEYMRWLTEEA